ncbi:MAG: DUF3418 domain-containing protein, partial [Jatrophihabitans sp.]
LDALRTELAAPVRAAVAAAVAADLERAGLRDWPDDLDSLAGQVDGRQGEHLVRGYPAFVDEGDTVALRVLATAAEQAIAMPAGVARLLRLSTASPVKAAERSLSSRARLVLSVHPGGPAPAGQGAAGGGAGPAALLEDCADAATLDLLGAQAPWTRTEFRELQGRAAAELAGRTIEVAGAVQQVLAVAHDVRRALPERPPAAQAAAVQDIRAQVRDLLPAGFVTRAGAGRLADLARYLRAISVRLEHLGRDVERDRARMLRVQAVQQAYDAVVGAVPAPRAAQADVRDIAWLIQEFRVSLWAQRLGTARPVSEQRIYRAIDAIAP